jgi:hypothetical protein
LENNLGKYILGVTVHLVTIKKVTHWIFWLFQGTFFQLKIFNIYINKI